jgi:hypothetical protein
MAPGVVVIVALGCRPQVGSNDDNAGPAMGMNMDASSSDRWKPLFDDVQGRQFCPFEESGVKAVVLVFVLHECPIANSYIPKLNELHKMFGKKGIRMFIVESDPHLTLQQARDHAREYSITAPVVLDTDHAWARRADATKAPEVAVFSPTAEILYRGRIDDQYAGLGQRRMQARSHELEDALNAISGDRAVAKPRTEVIGCYIPELPKEGK